MGYSKDELILLSKDVLADIILEQERRLNLSRRGQPKRDNLVGQTFGALTVVGDAGNQQGHSTWYCRCSSNIFEPELRGVCDRQVVCWGSNLKAERHQYCGNEKCPAARQVLALKRQKELPKAVVLRQSEFMEFLESTLKDRYTLMGKNASLLVEQDKSDLKLVLESYYGLNTLGQAYKLDEIEIMLGGKNDPSHIKHQLEEYIKVYHMKFGNTTS